MTLRLTLPRWLLPYELGLGDAIKGAAAAAGVKPCASCAERAARLNRVVVATPAPSPVSARPAVLAASTAGGSTPATDAPRAGGPDVVHVPHDKGTPADDTEKCCTYSVTLINRRRPLPWWLRWLLSWIWQWLWPQPYKVRVTATGGTTILDADPDDWDQVSAFPSSVTWNPGTGAALPLGDPTDSWIIDNDFEVSLGPPNTGVKTITIEYLGFSGNVIDAFRVKIPCLMHSTDDDFETDYEQYTSVTRGGQYSFAYLEPDDCDPGDFDERSSCDLTVSTPHCAFTTSGDNAYSVTFTAPSLYSSYQWSIDNVTLSQSGQTYQLTTLLSPGSHTVTVAMSDGNTTYQCGAELELTPPQPDFTWHYDACTRKVMLDGSITEKAGDVTAWIWLCSPPVAPVQGNNDAAVANFFNAPDGPYDITLRITDKWGCQWDRTHTVEVGGCQASWTVDYSWCVQKIDPTVYADVTVTFTNTSTGCNPTWQWNFDDAAATPQNPNTSTSASPPHTYVNAAHGDVHNVTLTLTSTSPPCTSTVTIPLTLMQRVAPQGTVKVCADGKLICRTAESNPVWTVSGSPHKKSWPYSKSDGSRVIYEYSSSGNQQVTLTNTDDNGNTCTMKWPITVTIGCCTKRAHAKATSSPISVQISGHSAQLRIKARLKQRQGPFWHRVKAKSILQRKNSHGHWRRYKSSAVRLEAMFNGTVYRNEWDPLAFDGSYFTGCTCELPTTTMGSVMQTFKKKVRAVDGLGGPFQSRVGSIHSQHGVTVGSTTYTMANLSLAPPC